MSFIRAKTSMEDNSEPIPQKPVHKGNNNQAFIYPFLYEPFSGADEGESFLQMHEDVRIRIYSLLPLNGY